MTRQDIFAWAKRRYGTEPDYPWGDNSAVLRHKENNKWYGLIMEVGRDKLGLPGEGTVEALNVKCDPQMVGALRTREGFHPAYHMNKEKWLTIALVGTVPAQRIQMLIDISFGLTAPKRKAPKQNQ